jgi:hypothetical protein
MQIPKACRSCGAPIYWLTSRVTGKTAPVDAEPTPNGSIAIDLTDATYVIVQKEARAPYQGMLCTNHFATCPSAARWHKPKTPGKPSGRKAARP